MTTDPATQPVGVGLHRLLMRYTFGDGFTWSCERVFPLLAESPEAALVAFEDTYQQAKAAGQSFLFAGAKFYPCDFEENDVYYAPDFLTLDEWFARAPAVP